MNSLPQDSLGLKNEADPNNQKIPCTMFHAGHNFHWIPVFNHSHPRVPATVKWLKENQFQVMVDGSTRVWYHHQPERLKYAIANNPTGIVHVTKGRPWLFVTNGAGANAFNCSVSPVPICLESNSRSTSQDGETQGKRT